jgi:uncharacterized protein (DUF433 family)
MQLRRAESAMTTAGEIYPGVTIDPQVHHGRPVLTGTRIAVEVVLSTLAAGESMEAVMDEYHLTGEQIRAALGYAADRISAEITYVVPANP